MTEPEFHQAAQAIYYHLADKQSSPEIFKHAAQDILRSEKGVPAQVVLVEASIALTRNAEGAKLHQFLGDEARDFQENAFRMIDRFGRPSGASQVLAEKLDSEEGLIANVKAEFNDIKTNLAHIDREVSEEQAVYWRLRIKSFKLNIIRELSAYVSAARSAVNKAGLAFNSSASLSLNRLLEAKQMAEFEQGILIKLRSTGNVAMAFDLRIVDIDLLASVLGEMVKDTDEAEFTRRLQSVLNKGPKLKIFVDLYDALSSHSGRQWQGIQGVSRDFAREIDQIFKNFHKTLDELIDIMDYAHLPDDLAIGGLVQPFMISTKSALEKLEIYANEWLETVQTTRTQLHNTLHPDSE